MCGICGIVNLNTSIPVDRGLLQRMNDIIEHRGPDAEGFFATERVGLAMRRLSIIDLSGGQQPIFNEQKTACVFLNGEIYNYRELRARLEAQGHQFSTNSDTEVIVHAYEQWGDECARYLSGMFAFAVWDMREEKLLIGRDRLGKKPLYYYDSGSRFLFGSEIKSILEDRSVPRRLNLEGLDAYLTLGYVPTPLTLFEGIMKLPAGHTLSISRGHYVIRKYWDLTYTDTRPALREEAYREEIFHLLKEAVRARLMSDVPLGAFLSGGIDSSIVVGLMSQVMNRAVDTYSVGFADPELNELPFANIAAEAFGSNHHELLVDTCTPELLDKLVWHLDEPVADPAAVPTFLVSELARQTVTVVLTGEGGDELFAGYDYYKMHRWAKTYRVLPTELGRRFVLPIFAKGVNTILSRQHFHERTVWHWSLPPGAQMAAWVAIFTDQAKDQIYKREFRRGSAENQSKEAFGFFYHDCDSTDEINRLMYIDTKVWLPDDLLMKVDKMSMAASIEARCPFLDHTLMQFVAKAPSRLKLNGDTSKFILKEIAKEILPEAILKRPKHSFSVPIEKWLTGSLRDLTRDLISEGIIKGSRLFEREYLEGALWQKLEANEPGVARQYWALVNLGLWARKYHVQSP